MASLNAGPGINPKKAGEAPPPQSKIVITKKKTFDLP